MKFDNETKASIADSVNIIGYKMDSLTAQLFYFAEDLHPCAEKTALEGSAYLASNIEEEIKALAQSLYDEHENEPKPASCPLPPCSLDCEFVHKAERSASEQCRKETEMTIELVKMLCEAKGETCNNKAINHYRGLAYANVIGVDVSELKDDTHSQQPANGNGLDCALLPGELPPF